jgi:hypothetical protein
VQEFVLMYAAMKLPELKTQLLEAQRQLQTHTTLTLQSGKSATFTQWVWPEAAMVQNLLQQRAMQTVVAPTDHSHVVPTEIRAEVKSANAADFSSVNLQLPVQFQQVLVVSYQPKQVWLKPHMPSPAISF